MVNWRKSTHSGANGGACIEVASADVITVRDTVDRGGFALSVNPSAWATFVNGLRKAQLSADSTRGSPGRNLARAFLCFGMPLDGPRIDAGALPGHGWHDSLGRDQGLARVPPKTGRGSAGGWCWQSQRADPAVTCAGSSWSSNRAVSEHAAWSWSRHGWQIIGEPLFPGSGRGAAVAGTLSSPMTRL